MSLKGTIVKAAHVVAFKAKIGSPYILFGVGAVAGVAAVVEAVKATPKADSIIAEHKAEVDKITEAKNIGKFSGKYTDEDAQKDNFIVTVQTAWKFMKLYWKPIALEGLSLACFGGALHIVSVRLAGAVAAYNILDSEFRRYRANNIALNGEESDEKCRYGDLTKVAVEPAISENGVPYNKVVTDPSVENLDRYDYSIHIGPDNCLWDKKNPELTEKNIEIVQLSLNNRLTAAGYLQMSEAKRAFGVSRNPEDFVTGWVEKEFGGQDGYVMVTVKKITEDDWLLDFNVDGIIIDKVGKIEKEVGVLA